MNKNFCFSLLTALLLLVSATVHAEDWMWRLNDNVYVSRLSIPGSHDAATGSGWSGILGVFGDRYAKTQELSIGEQWSAGVRAFDLRPSVYENHMNLNHGIMATKLHLEDVLCELRDSLIAHPTEFVIIHLLHTPEGDEVEGDGVYESRLLEVLGRDDLKDYFMGFRKMLTVGQMRGKILLLSRDKYADVPIGGFFQYWTGAVDWERQTSAQIVGQKASGIYLSPMWVQDFSDTHTDGALATKVEAVKKMLTESMKHKTTTAAAIRWVFNFSSAYSKVDKLFGNEISLSDGYRDNAVATHAAILDHLATSTVKGPTGVIMMDFAGVDRTGSYDVRGKELVDAIIANNFTYLDDLHTKVAQVSSICRPVAYYSLDGRSLHTPRRGSVVIVKYEDGKSEKVIY